jgi:hypothetical protein
MLKFHVDLHTVNSEGTSDQVKFSSIVNAENAENAKKEALSLLKKEQPELTPPDAWQWSIYEFPLG